MSSIFTRIVNGEIPCYKLAENDKYIAFLDINPIAKGHSLVLPKKETDYILDIEDEDFQGLFLFAKMVGKALGSCVPCERIGIAVIGLEVRHAHIHLIPINSVYDIDFKKAKLKFTHEEFMEIASKVTSLLASANSR